jgi:hypothetical protein
MTLEGALGNIMERLPQHKEITDLRQLYAEIRGAKAFLSALIDSDWGNVSLGAIPSRCAKCGRYFSTKDIHDGVGYFEFSADGFRAWCPLCTVDMSEVTDV